MVIKDWEARKREESAERGGVAVEVRLLETREHMHRAAVAYLRRM